MAARSSNAPATPDLTATVPGPASNAQSETAAIVPADASADVIKRLQAETACMRFSSYSAAGGLIPVPLLDIVAITAIQVRMIEVLCVIYDRKFNDQTAKTVLTTLIANFGVYPVASRYIASALKIVPGIGPLLSISAAPAISGAMTYGLGRMFAEHFERGGTLLDVDLSNAKTAFNKFYATGKAKLASAAEVVKQPFAVPSAAPSAAK